MTKRETLRSLTIAISTATAVALSGCGGGSSNTMPDGGATGPVVFTAGVDRVYPSQRTERLTDDGASMVTRTASGWNLTIGGRTVTYTDSDHFGTNPDAPANFYTKLIGNEEIWFWSEEGDGFEEGDPAPEFDYLNIYGFSHHELVPGADLATVEPDDYTRGDYIYVVHGTPTSEMPVTGTASYDGRVEAREWSSDAAGFAGTSTFYDGDFSMTATFGGSGAEVTGTFSFPSVPGGIIPFDASVNGNQLSISGKSIDTGHFAGYENIGVRAAFFGPAAAEVGGAFEGDNPTAGTVIHGYFAGEKQ